MATDFHLVHLGMRALGGSGLVFTEATAVEPEGRISPQDLGIWSDDHIPGLKRASDFVKAHGAASGIQLAHAGRKASTYRPWSEVRGAISAEDGGWTPIKAPSAVRFSERSPVPHAMTEPEILEVVDRFAEAAHRANIAGFDVAEIHAAHGYLIHEFLSPISNHRTDIYGGDFAGRTFLIKQITAAVRRVWPEGKPLFVRISASDWMPGGWTIEESVELSVELKGLGVDLVDCSSGGTSLEAKIAVGPGYQVPFAEQIRKEAGIMTGAVGMITEAAQAEEIVASGRADLVLLARENLRRPQWPLEAARELGVDVAWPSQYERAKL